MAWANTHIWLISISFFVALIFWLFSKNISSKLRPPGPPGWPVIGNILDVGTTPHQNLQKLQSKYGPVLWLKLGSVNTMVIQSAAAAAELFKKHDLPFSDRRVPYSLTAVDYHNGSTGLARYSKYPRYRRFLATELLVQKRISDSAPTRQKCIDNMIQWIKVDADGGSMKILLDRYLVIMTFNMIANFVVSRDIMDSNIEEGNQFFKAMHNFLEWSGKPNVADSFPFLKLLDPQRIRSNTEKYLKQLLKIIEGIVKERIEEKLSGVERTTKDFLDACLEYKGDDENGLATTDKVSEKNMSILILEMFFAGSETTSSSLHWAMSELLRNPDSMKQLKAEIDEVIGNSKKVEETDLTQLPYLQAVVKETMRLHPSLPLLIPRNSVQDTEFMGYHIPKNTMILVNAWAIHRDPDSWDDPLSFNPERFLNSDIDHRGKNFKLIPFGYGRRSCIGMFMGDKMVALTLARLIQSFEWVLPADVSPNTIDMREIVGIAVRKAVPLKVIPKERVVR